MKNIKSLSHLNDALAPKIKVSGIDYLYFGGTAYLGIPQNKAFFDHYVQGLQRFGLNNGTSRNNNIQLGIYNDAEQYASAYFGAEAALITSSGYLAAQLAVQYASGLGQIRYAPATHPALWLNGDPNVQGSFADWAKAIVSEINGSNEKKWVLVSNSMNNLFPEIYDFGLLSAVGPGKDIVVLIDDSHGIGVLGGGLGAPKSIPGATVIYIASLAKGPGVDAGIILTSATHIEGLKQMPQFPGASPPAAAGLYAFMQSAGIYRQEHNKLKVLQQQLMDDPLIQDHFEYIVEFPAFLHRDHQLADRLEREQVLISAFPYAGSKGAKINRIVLSSWHTESHLKGLLKALPLAIKA